MRMLNTPQGDYYIGDLVEGAHSHRFVNSIIDGYGGPQPPGSFVLLLTQEFHPAWTGSYDGVPSNSVTGLPAVVSRGNYYRRKHGLPLEPFDTPMNEAYFYHDMEEARVDGSHKVSSMKEFLRLIRNGSLDGYFVTESTLMMHTTSWHGIVMKDRVLGRELAKRTLAYHNPLYRLWKRVQALSKAT